MPVRSLALEIAVLGFVARARELSGRVAHYAQTSLSHLVQPISAPPYHCFQFRSRRRLEGLRWCPGRKNRRMAVGRSLKPDDGSLELSVWANVVFIIIIIIEYVSQYQHF